MSINLITAILGYSEIVYQNIGNDVLIKKDIEQIKSAAEKAANLTKSILTFSRKKALNPRPVNINKTITGLVKLLESMIERDVGLKTNLSSDELIVNADEGQMEQVLMNLASNARDAMPEGGILSIETKAVDINERSAGQHISLRPGKYVLITVTDSGEGIDEDIREKIFEPFYTTKGSEKGTGLGLSIVYSIIHQHNGYIGVKSAKGKGTSFEIYLPLTETEVLSLEGRLLDSVIE